MRANTSRNWRRSRSATARAVALWAIAVLTLAACGQGDAPDTDTGANVSPTAPAVRAGATETIARAAANAAATGTASATRATTPAPTRTPQPTPESARTPTPLPTPAPAIGDSVTTDGWRVTVTGVDLYDRIGVSRASGVYLFVRLSIVNTTDQPRPFPFDGLVVVGGDDATWFPDLAATRESLTFDFGLDIAEALQPGVERAAAIAFDIPTDVTGLVLTTPSRVFQIRLEYTDQPK